jgi:hypothetical protein
VLPDQDGKRGRNLPSAHQTLTTSLRSDMTNSFSPSTFWLIISYYEGRFLTQRRGEGKVTCCQEVGFGKTLKKKERVRSERRNIRE